MSTESILRDLRTVMERTFPDRDYSGDIGPETTVFGDLGLASIDLVVFAEKLEAHYGKRLPFGAFLSELRNRGAVDLTIGDLAAFIGEHG